MKGNKKLHIFLVFLAGALISVMLVMMRLGGGVNFEEFMSADRVYDFEPSELRKNSSHWLYESENGGHRILKNKARIKYELDGSVQTWNFLYITVEQLDMESVQGLLRYYNHRNKKVLEQPITLVQGRNMIEMDATVPIKKIGIVVLDAQEEFISISDIQIRTTPSWFTIPHFLELFGVAFAGVMVILIVLLLLMRRFGRENRGRTVDVLLESLQSGIKVLGDFLGSRMGGRLYPHQKESMRKFLFSLLFVWMMVGSAAGWLASEEIYRYYVLVCALLLLVISFVSWERPLQNQHWNNPLMVSWLCIWLCMLLCNFFMIRTLESVTVCAMLLAGSVFVYFWQNMEKPDRMLSDLMGALEITFFLAIIYCMAFRMKKPAIDYNGMFKNPEELAMYAVLMGVVFLTELDWLITDRITGASAENTNGIREGVFASCVKNITGGAIALFLVLRSSHDLGIAIFILLGICYIPNMMMKIYGAARKCRILFLDILVAVIFAYACVCIIFVSTKYFPGILGMDMEYENELLLTELDDEEQELYLMQYPGSLDGVKDKDAAKLPIIWRGYARRLNLFGHSGGLSIFRREILPYNGYLDMAYHHGIFILLPYMAFQITVIALGLRCAFRKSGRRNIYMLFLGIAYVGFSLGSNVELSWGHPLWLCYFLSVGYLGRLERKKT